MPVDSVKNIERAFTGRIPIVTLNNDTPINQVFTLINYAEVLNRVKPSSAINVILSVALEQLQLISYLPGLSRPYRLPEYDEDLIPALKRQAEDLEWMAEFNPTTGNAIEITLFEKFDNRSWQAIARKWLYNQQVEYYLDLINPFLNNKKASDIGDAVSSYCLGVAITQKPTSQTVNGINNYIRIRGSYSGIVTYEQGTTVKQLTKSSGNLSINLNVPVSVLSARLKRKIVYLQNTGLSKIYFNFDNNLIGLTSPYLLPGETLNYESGKFVWSCGGNQFLPPLAEYLIQDGLFVFCEGKDKDDKSVIRNSISWIEFYEV